jgi:hypothetical protein
MGCRSFAQNVPFFEVAVVGLMPPRTAIIITAGIHIWEIRMLSAPPHDLPQYRLLTGKDDPEFCHRVSEALALGYQLYGSPAATFNGEHVVVAQALLWPES